MKITIKNPNDLKTAIVVSSELKKSGFRPIIVGSVAKRGHSIHDIDIYLPITLNEDEKEQEDEFTPQEVARYRRKMERMNFVLTPYGSDESDYWIRKSDNTNIDVFLNYEE